MVLYRTSGPPLLLPLLLAGCAIPVAGWRTWGKLPVGPSFVQYVGKFCFDYSKKEEAGRFEVEVTGEALEETSSGSNTSSYEEGSPCWGPCDPTGGLYFMVFDDEDDHWKFLVDHEPLTCKDYLAHASWAHRLTQSGDKSFKRSEAVVEKLRPRFWYFTFAACDFTGREDLPPLVYAVHAENLLQGLQDEFGVDERGSLVLQVLAAFCFGALAFGLHKTGPPSSEAQAFRVRPLLRILVYSCFFSATASVFLAIHYLAYTVDGYGVAAFKVCGVIVACVSKGLLSVLQLLMSKGWVLFYSPGEIAWRRFTTLALGGIILTSAACEIHATYFRDYRTTLYLYESPSGIFILFLNMLLFGEATRSMHATYEREASSEVRTFYVAVSAALATYFLALPVMCVLAAVLSPWVRLKYVMRVEVVSRVVAFVLLGYCLRPTRLDLLIRARLEGAAMGMAEEEEEVEEEGGYMSRPEAEGEKTPEE